MGLDLYMLVPKHSGFSMGYGRFNDLRRRFAKEIGMNLDEMEGFGGEGKFEDWHDPLVLLLDHDDNEGELSPSECAEIYPRILDVTLGWEQGTEKDQARDLANVLKECAEEGYTLSFQ